MPQRTEVKKLYNGGLSSSQAVIYTAPSEQSVLLSTIILHNTHTSSVTVELWVVPTSTSLAYSHKFLKVSIPQDETRTIMIPQILNPADRIYAQAGTNTVVSIFLHGSELTTV